MAASAAIASVSASCCSVVESVVAFVLSALSVLVNVRVVSETWSDDEIELKKCSVHDASVLCRRGGHSTRVSCLEMHATQLLLPLPLLLLSPDALHATC